MKKVDAVRLLYSADYVDWDELFPAQSTDNGFVFKNERAYWRDEVCYISEYGLEELQRGDADETVFNDREDFLDVTGGDERQAYRLFRLVDWQSPEAAWTEDEMEDDAKCV